MNDTVQISKSLRHKLLLKIISKAQPKPEDVDAIIDLTSSKIVELLQAQSITFYLVQGDNICFKHVYYSPTLMPTAEKETEFAEKRKKLLKMVLPVGTGLVGKCIDNEEPAFFSQSKQSTRPIFDLFKDTGFKVTSMLTVPLIAGKCIGAIQVINKEPHAFSKEFRRDDLRILEEVSEYTAPLIHRIIDPSFSVADEVIAKYIARFTESELVSNLEAVHPEKKLIETVGDSIIRQTNIFPCQLLSPNSVSVLMINPFDYPSRELFTKQTELTIEEVKVAPANVINELFKQFFGEDEEQDAITVTAAESEAHQEENDISELADVIGAEYTESIIEISDEVQEENSTPIIQLANRIIEDAYIAGASDIHIEPQENEIIVRYRIDGICAEKLKLPSMVGGALVARLKVMSNLDIAEKRLPQDGRIVFKHFTKKNMDIDLRIATGPMNFGEKVVMRVLDKNKSALPIMALGFSQYNLDRYRELIKQPYGMILHCGPTGSGKSMTLFSALREIASPSLNIQTAEDPIEYTLPGINQMQMHKQIGLNFARALRAYLRMDPDVILVGEIRDQETAEISVEAALTGHLLLSTLHTNDAPSTIARFGDLGIEPFMISASMLVVCAQRLMRRACKNCKKSYVPEGNELSIIRRALDNPEFADSIFKASDGGCPACNNHSYKGRIGIHELMVNNEELTRAINEGAKTVELKRIAMETGMKTLHQDSMLKVIEGTSTVLEALSTVPPDALKRKKLDQSVNSTVISGTY